jgi:hypothetical protein
VLLVEAGRDSEIDSDVLVPGKYVRQLQEDKEGLWELATVSQKELNDRKLVFPAWKTAWRKLVCSFS